MAHRRSWWSSGTGIPTGRLCLLPTCAGCADFPLVIEGWSDHKGGHAIYPGLGVRLGSTLASLSSSVSVVPGSRPALESEKSASAWSALFGGLGGERLAVSPLGFRPTRCRTSGTSTSWCTCSAMRASHERLQTLSGWSRWAPWKGASLVRRELPEGVELGPS